MFKHISYTHTYLVRDQFSYLIVHVYGTLGCIVSLGKVVQERCRHTLLCVNLHIYDFLLQHDTQNKEQTKKIKGIGSSVTMLRCVCVQMEDQDEHHV